MNKYISTFYEEASELLAELEILLIDIKDQDSKEEALNKILRNLHTLKGSSAMFGLDLFSGFVHKIEEVFVDLQNGELVFSPSYFDKALEAKDVLEDLIKEEEDYENADLEKIETLASYFISVSNNSKPVKEKIEATSPLKSEVAEIEQSEKIIENIEHPAEKAEKKWLVRFKPFIDFFQSGNKPLLLLKELEQLGETKIKLDYSMVPDLDSIEPENSYFSWEILVQGPVDKNDILDVFVFAEGLCELEVKSVPISWDFIELPENPLAENLMPEKNSREPLTQQQKLDNLVEQLGELVTIQARLSQTADSKGDADFISIARELESLSSELSASALKLSMVHIASVFPQLKNYAQEIAEACNKKIEFVFEGGETEVSKVVIEELLDSLKQLLKSSIELGIEKPEKRKKLGKPEFGKIHFSVWISTGNVWIKIKDDGQEIKSEKVTTENKVEAKTDESQSPEDQASKTRKNNLFRVRDEIKKLRGDLKFENNSGIGLTATIRVPINQAIIEGLLVKIDAGIFLIPLSVVEECIELTKATRNKNYDKDVIMVRGNLVPYIGLREFFRATGSAPDIQQVVITKMENQKIGFVVDEVIGECKAVIKTWGNFCANVPGISGVTILGDGSIALITDLAGVLREN